MRASVRWSARCPRRDRAAGTRRWPAPAARSLRSACRRARSGWSRESADGIVRRRTAAAPLVGDSQTADGEARKASDGRAQCTDFISTANRRMRTVRKVGDSGHRRVRAPPISGDKLTGHHRGSSVLIRLLAVRRSACYRRAVARRALGVQASRLEAPRAARLGAQRHIDSSADRAARPGPTILSPGLY